MLPRFLILFSFLCSITSISVAEEGKIKSKLEQPILFGDLAALSRDKRQLKSMSSASTCTILCRSIYKDITGRTCATLCGETGGTIPLDKSSFGHWSSPFVYGKSLTDYIPNFISTLPETTREQRCGCYMDEPVCGWDSRTYRSNCSAACLGSVPKYDGECDVDKDKELWEKLGVPENNDSEEDDSGMDDLEDCGDCPNDVDTLCGTDGQTYANECHAECRGVETYHIGPCNSFWPFWPSG